MKFELKIESGNAALGEDGEVARLLREAAKGVQNGGETEGKLIDFNGNTVGSWTLERERLDAESLYYHLENHLEGLGLNLNDASEEALSNFCEAMSFNTANDGKEVSV